MVWLTFFPAPEGQPVKRLKHQILGAKLEKSNPEEEGSQYEEEGSQYKSKWKNPRRTSVRVEGSSLGMYTLPSWIFQFVCILTPFFLRI